MEHYYTPEIDPAGPLPEKHLSIEVEPGKILVVCPDGSTVPDDWTLVARGDVESEHPGMLDSIAHPVPYAMLVLILEG